MEYCLNCMEDIVSHPIEAEIEINVRGDEGEPERDVPVTRFFCSEDCREEFLKTNQ